jgi:transcriptional/translational regulatory protein YebC/TACO1
VTCEPGAVEDVRAALEGAGIKVSSADSTMVSSTLIEVASAEDARKVLRVMDALEEHDDVQDVYANFDIPDAVMEQVDA